MESMLISLIEGLRKVLPLSPFAEWIETIGELPFLGWLNWFFPVGACLAVVFAWLGVLGLFYMYSIVMRWIKVIDG